MKQELKLVITDFISVNHYLAHRAFMKNKTPIYKIDNDRIDSLTRFLKSNNPISHLHICKTLLFYITIY